MIFRAFDSDVHALRPHKGQQLVTSSSHRSTSSKQQRIAFKRENFFHPSVKYLALKNHPQVARRLRSLLHSETYPSEIAQSHRFCNRVQDAYTLRCAPQVKGCLASSFPSLCNCPQVHGIVHDTIDFVRGLITTEMNSATDNPIVLVSIVSSPFWQLFNLSFIPDHSNNPVWQADRGETISAGNFHGEYPAKALDYLAIGD